MTLIGDRWRNQFGGKENDKTSTDNKISNNVKDVTLKDGSKITFDSKASSVDDGTNFTDSFFSTLQSIGAQFSKAFGSADAVDDEVDGLLKNGKPQTDSEKAQYVQMLYEYDTLKNKDTLTAPEVAAKLNLENELSLYTTKSREKSTGSWSWLKNLWYDKIKGAVNESYGDSREIDTGMILDKLNGSSSARIAYGIDSTVDQGNKSKESNWYDGKTLNKSDLRKANTEANIKYFEDRKAEKEREVAEKLIKNGYQARSNPGGRASTVDEVLGDIYAAYNSAGGVYTTMEDYKNLYSKIGDDEEFANISSPLEKSQDAIIDMIGYILEYKDGDTVDAYNDYLNKGNMNGLALVQNIDKSKLTDKESRLIAPALGAFAGGYIGDGSNAASTMFHAYNQFFGDEHHTGLVQFGYDIGNEISLAGAILKGWASGLEGLGGALITEGLDEVYARGDKELIKEIGAKDFGNLYYGIQSSGLFNIKEDVQSPDMSDKGQLYHTYFKYLSIVDDILLFRYTSKKIDFSVKGLGIFDITKVGKNVVKAEQAVSKTSKVAKVVNTAEKTAEVTEKVVTGTEEIISGVEKVSSAVDKGSKIKNILTGTKNVVTTIGKKLVSPVTNFAKNAGSSAVADASLGTKALNISENIARWVGEEAITSALFQGFTSYDYNSSDLAFDVAGAGISGFIRTVGWVNKTGMNRFIAKDQVWGLWYLREVEGLSEAKALERFNKLSDIERGNLSRLVKDKLGIVADTTQEWTRGKFKTKAQAASEGFQKLVTKFIDDTIHNSEQNLMRKFARAKDKNMNNLVKRVHVVKEDGTKVTEYQWNTKYDLSHPKQREQHLKLINKYKAKLRKLELKERTISGKASRIRALGKTIKDNIGLYGHKSNLTILVNGERVTIRSFFKKVKGKGWVFKDGVSKEIKQQIFDTIFRNRLKKEKFTDGSYVGMPDRIKDSKERVRTLFGLVDLGVRDTDKYEEGIVGLFSLRVNLMINALITQKEITKDKILALCATQGELFNAGFYYWFKNISDFNKSPTEATLDELIEGIKEFSTYADSAIMPDFVNRVKVWRAKNTTFSDSKNLLCNMTYDDAIKNTLDGNGHSPLSYMGYELFSSIASDPTLTVIEKETILRSYNPGNARYGHEKGVDLYGIDIIPGGDTNRPRVKAFNDTYDEKVSMGESGTVYVRYKKDTGNTVRNNKANANKNGYKSIDRTAEQNDEFVKCTYKLKSGTNGRKEYAVYKGDEVIGTIKTQPDVDLDTTDDGIFNKGRVMKFEPMGDQKVGYRSVNLSFSKKTDARIQYGDVKLKAENTGDIKITDDTFDFGDGYKKRESTLKQRNEFSGHVISGEPNYQKFVGIIPGYTDVISPEFYYAVMNTRGLRDVDKANLLMAAMFNKNIKATENGLYINMSNSKQFRMKGYTYKRKVDNPDGSYKLVEEYVPGDGDAFIAGYNKGTCIVDSDTEGKKVYYYQRQGNEILLYDTPPNTPKRKVKGHIVIGNEGFTGYTINGNKHFSINKSIEFIEGGSIDDAIKVNDIRTGNIKKRYKIKAKKGVTEDDLWVEVYQKIHGRAPTQTELHRLKSTPNLNPEIYLNSYVNKFQESRLGRFVGLRSKNWEKVIEEINKWKNDLKDGEYLLSSGKIGISDKQMFNLIVEVREERLKNGGIMLYSKGDYEARDMLLGEDSDRMPTRKEEFIIRAHTKYGIIPQKIDTPAQQRLKRRRDTILLAIYKKPSVLELSDGEKDLLIQRSKKAKNMMNMTEAEIIEDMKRNPAEYKKFIKSLGKIVIGGEAEFDTTKELGELSEVQTKISSIDKQINGTKDRSYKTTELSEKLREEVNEYIFAELNGRLEIAKENYTEAMEAGDTEAMERYQKEIDELKGAISNMADINNSKAVSSEVGGMTQEQYDFIAKSESQGIDHNYAPELSQKEIDNRIAAIQERTPGIKIIMRNSDGTVSTRGFTEQEKEFFKDRINVVANAINNDSISAAHAKDLHAIVIDPEHVTSMDINHEWFHEAISLAYGTEEMGRIEDVFNNTWVKNHEDIEKFAVNKGYDNLYADLRSTSYSEYQKKITEEWLAERFADYIATKVTEGLDNELIILFRELWNRMCVLLSDTGAVELFDDIYYGRLGNRPIDLSDAADKGINYRGTTINYNKFFEGYNGLKEDGTPLLGDDGLYEVIDTMYNDLKFSQSDIIKGVDSGYSGMGTFLTSIVSDKTGTSFDGIIRSICDSNKNNAYNFIEDFLTTNDVDYNSFFDNFQTLFDGGYNSYRYAPVDGVSISLNITSVRGSDSEYTFMCSVYGRPVIEINHLNNRLKATTTSDNVVNEIKESVRNKLVSNYGRQSVPSKIRQNLFDIMTTSDLTEGLSDDIVNYAVDSLEDVIRNKYKQGTARLKPEKEYLMREAYVIYLFNRYIPHIQGNKINDALMKRKTELTTNLVNRIFSQRVVTNSAGEEMVYSYKDVLERIGDIKVEILPQNGDTYTFNIYFYNDPDKNYAPMKIGWHVKSDIFNGLSQDALNEIETTKEISNEHYIWNMSLLSAYDKFQGLNLINSPELKGTYTIGQSWTEIAKDYFMSKRYNNIEDRVMANGDLKKYVLGANQIPIYVDQAKGFAITKDMQRGGFEAALESESKGLTLLSSSAGIKSNAEQTSGGHYGSITLIGRKRPQKWQKEGVFEHGIVSLGDMYSPTFEQLDLLLGDKYLQAAYDAKLKGDIDGMERNLKEMGYIFGMGRDIDDDGLSTLINLMDEADTLQREGLFETVTGQAFHIKNALKKAEGLVKENINILELINNEGYLEEVAKLLNDNALGTYSNQTVFLAGFITDKMIASLDNRINGKENFIEAQFKKPLQFDNNRMYEASNNSINGKGHTVEEVADRLIDNGYLKPSNRDEFIYQYTIYKGKTNSYSYFEMYSPIWKMSDFWGVRVSTQDDLAFVEDTLKKNGYTVTVVDVNSLTEINKKSLEKVAKNANNKKHMVVLYNDPANENSRKLSKAISTIDYRSKGLTREDVEVMDGMDMLGKVKPVSVGRLVDSKRNLNRVLSKYGITINNASNETKESINNIKKDIKKMRENSDATISKSKRKMLENQRLKLSQEENRLTSIIDKKVEGLEAYRENNPAYRELELIKSILDNNDELLKEIKNADDTKIVSRSEDIITSKPTNEVIQPTKETKATGHPPIGIYFEGQEISGPSAFLNKIENFSDLQSVGIEGGYLDEERRFVTSIAPENSWVVFPMTKGNLEDEDLMLDMSNTDCFVIWGPDAETVETAVNNFNMRYYSHTIEYKRPDGEVVYMKNVRSENDYYKMTDEPDYEDWTNYDLSYDDSAAIADSMSNLGVCEFKHG